MDDSIMIVASRAEGEAVLAAIAEHLASLGLEISHYRLQPIKRGANFVGFRTWRSARFVRKHVLNGFRKDVRKGRLTSVISRLGHARKTHSFNPMMNFIKEHNHDLYRQLPKAFRRAHHQNHRSA
jgi:hypothetical protein